MSFLVVGISRAVVLAIFSSDIPGSFVVPREVPALGVIFTEPDESTISRQAEHATSHHHLTCGRQLIPTVTEIVHGIYGGKDNLIKINRLISNKTTPFKNRMANLTEPISNYLQTFPSIRKPIEAMISTAKSIKSDVYHMLGLECLFPKMLRPFEPILKYSRCKLGLEDDGFMEVPRCQSFECQDPSVEDRMITHDKGLRNLDFIIEGRASTMDDCFPEMKKVTYGSRIQAKLVDDQSCDDPRYEAMCQEQIDQNRILHEDDCISDRYYLPNIIFIYIYRVLLRGCKVWC